MKKSVMGQIKTKQDWVTGYIVILVTAVSSEEASWITEVVGDVDRQ